MFGEDDSEHVGIPYFYDNNTEESSWTHPNEEKISKLVDEERIKKKERSRKSKKNIEKEKNIPKEEIIELEDFDAEPLDMIRSSRDQVQSRALNRSKAASLALSPPADQEESEFSPSHSFRALPISAREKGASVTTQSRDRDREKEKERERERELNNAAKVRDRDRERDRQIERDSQRDKARDRDKYYDEIRTLKDTNKVKESFSL